MLYEHCTYRPKLLKVALHIFQRCGGRQTTHEYLFCSRHHLERREEKKIKKFKYKWSIAIIFTHPRRKLARWRASRTSKSFQFIQSNNIAHFIVASTGSAIRNNKKKKKRSGTAREKNNGKRRESPTVRATVQQSRYTKWTTRTTEQ